MDEQAFLFAHIEPHLANVCLSMTGKLANAGCGFLCEGEMNTEKALSCIEIGDDKSCWNWTASTGSQNKYGHLRFEGKYEYAHRFAWEYFIGNIPEGLQVLHHCDNPLCCNPKHLYLGKPVDNMRDRDRRGRNGAAKYDQDTIKEIRDNYKSGSYTYPELANKYGCHKTTIGKIIRKITYKWMN